MVCYSQYENKEIYMEGVKFRSTYANGVIRVPDQFRDSMERDVEVIVQNIKNDRKKKRPLKFEALNIDTRGFTFNRDEANER